MGSQCERLTTHNKMQWVLVGCWLAAVFGSSAESPVSGEAGYVCPPHDGTYMDPRSCEQFYECVNGHVTHHGKCPGVGGIFDPWRGKCSHNQREIACDVYIHPEDHWVRHVYYIKAGGNTTDHYNFKKGQEKCGAVGLYLVSIKNWDEDTFVKDFT